MAYHLTSEIEYLSDLNTNLERNGTFTNGTNGTSECSKHGKDKTYNGITTNVFSSQKPYIHAGCSVEDNRNLVKKSQSYSLFYPQKEETFYSSNAFPIQLDQNIIIGFGKIVKIGDELETITKGRSGKIYCYSFYGETSDESTDQTFVFRFPFQELFTLQNENIEIQALIDNVINELTSENNERMFFKYKSKLIPSTFLLKYLKKIYKAVNILKSNKIVWDKVNDEKYFNKNSLTYFNENSLKFLNDAITEIKMNLEEMINPGLLSVCEYLKIDNTDNIQKKLDEKIPIYYDKIFLKLFADEKYKKYKIYNEALYSIYKNYLMYYPLTKKNIEDISIHLGINNIKNDNDSIEIFSYSNDEFPIKPIKPFEIIKNPYVLYENFIQSEDKNLSFDVIDWGEKTRKKSRSETFENYSQNRIVAIVYEYFNINKNSTGHVWLNKYEVEKYIINKIILLDGNIDNDINIIQSINNALKSHKITIKNDFLTLTVLFKKEQFINKFITQLIDKENIENIENIELDHSLNDEQKIAIKKMENFNLTFVYGVAGAGKSHTLCQFIHDNLDTFANNYRIMVPTGKAASVLKEKLCEKNTNDEFYFPKIIQSEEEFSNLKANISTYHSFLTKDHRLYNTHLNCFLDKKEYSPSNLDVLIIDEISMMGMEDFYLLLKFYNPTKLIVIGDIKQLPPVNAYGSIATSLYNYLNSDEDKRKFIAKLLTARRANPEQSKFLTLASKLRDLSLNLNDEDLKTDTNYESLCVLKYSDNTSLEKSIEQIYKNVFNLEDFKNCIIEDANMIDEDIFQILCPTKSKESGTYNINNFLKNQINSLENRVLKYIKTKNDNTTGVLNGMFGKGRKVERDLDTEPIQVEEISFINDANTVTEDYNKQNHELAYAITVHKSQGSGFDNVERNLDTESIQVEEISFINDANTLTEDYNKQNHELAYAITVHKSQGSGFDNVVLILPKDSGSFISRELIYTAITRPKKKLFIVHHVDNLDILKSLRPLKPRNTQIFETDILNNTDDYSNFEFSGEKYSTKIDLLTAVLFKKYQITEYSYNADARVFRNVVQEDNIFTLVSYSKIIKRLLIEDKDLFDFIKVLKINEIPLINKENSNEREDENVENFMNSKTTYIPPSDLLEITLGNGIVVRSISEAVLTTLFEIIDLPYFYESELWANDSNNSFCQISYPSSVPVVGYSIKIRPDFVISNESFNKTNNIFKINEVKFFIEHLGMLNSEKYRNHWKNKIVKYNSLGYKIIPLNAVENLDSGLKIWDISGEIVSSNDVLCKADKVCFTTDEEDLRDIDNLLKKLKLLKEFYFPKQESK